MDTIQFNVSANTSLVNFEDWKGAFSRLFPERAAMLKSELFDDAVIEAREQGWFLDMHIFEDEE